MASPIEAPADVLVQVEVHGAEQLVELGHWQLEALHWVRDAAFAEDAGDPVGCQKSVVAVTSRHRLTKHYDARRLLVLIGGGLVWSGRSSTSHCAVSFISVVAIALGVAFLGERVAPAALLGTALVLAGAWLTSRREA